MPAGPASNNASSIIVIIADDADFQISGVLAIVKNRNSDTELDFDDDIYYFFSVLIFSPF
jgi:hypothetical protein